MVLNSTKNLKKYLLSVALMLLTSAVFSQGIIKGNVTDAKNGETLIGATVHIANGNFQLNTTVKLDGVYVFKNVPAGTYKLQIKFVGYNESKEYTVEVTKDNTVVL